MCIIVTFKLPLHEENQRRNNLQELEIIPANYLKPITGVSGLYEIRVQLASNIFRIFCLFESDGVVVLLSGFQKKDQKIPQSEIEKPKRIMNEYYNEKKGSYL